MSLQTPLFIFSNPCSSVSQHQRALENLRVICEQPEDISEQPENIFEYLRAVLICEYFEDFLRVVLRATNQVVQELASNLRTFASGFNLRVFMSNLKISCEYCELTRLFKNYCAQLRGS